MTWRGVMIRRTVSVGVFLVLITATVWGLTSLTVSLDMSVRSAQTKLARYDRLAAEKPVLESQIAALGAEQRTGPGELLPGASSVQAAAAFQEAVKQAIEGLGGRVQSLEALPETEQDGFERIALRLTATIGHGQLQTFLYDLETGRPAILVDRLLSRPATQRSSARRRQQAGEAVDLELTATLSAFRSLSAEEVAP